MNPNTGTYAYYTFSPRFSGKNGIYTVVKIQSFSNALSDGVDFYTKLYDPCGLSQDTYTQDSSNYIGDDVYFLQATDGTTVYPFPESLITSEPDYSVGKFHNLYLSVYLGYWDDANKISWVSAMINDIVSQVTGSTTSAAIRFADPDSVWMRDGEYKQLADTRAAQAQVIKPLSQQVKELSDEVDSLKSKNQYYEQLLIQAGITNKT